MGRVASRQHSARVFIFVHHPIFRRRYRFGRRQHHGRVLLYLILMNAYIDHVSLNVGNLEKSKVFYDSFLTFLGFIRHPTDGWVNEYNGIWINQVDEKYASASYHRKRIGMSHLAFRVDSKQEVDEFYEQYLIANRIPVLYGDPKEYPKYAKGYYAVYFEDPDRIKLEVMHLP
jgi:catechol 2,3-dioxygenase-like lactoylglutathione lyase family enzyme